MSKILRKIGKKKKELLERKIGGEKAKIGSALLVHLMHALPTMAGEYTLSMPQLEHHTLPYLMGSSTSSK